MDAIQARRKRIALAKLRMLAKADDAETAHAKADQVLVDYIADEDIAAAFKAVTKWYG